MTSGPITSWQIDGKTVETVTEFIFLRDSRGERSPWLPLETRPDSPGEPGMQPRDPCVPWRGKLGPGHTLR